MRSWLPGSVLAAAAVGWALGGGCDPVPLGDGPRRAAIKALAAEHMVPGLATLEAEAYALVAVVAGGPFDGARVAAARAAWRRARAAWKRVEPVGLGPVTTERLGARIDQSPVDAANVLALVDTATLTVEAVGALGANRVGFHALEALLFDAEAERRLIGEPRFARLVVVLAELLAADAARLHAGWVEGYARRLGDIGAADAEFATAADAMDALVNVLIAHTERILVTRLGKPLGHDAGGVARPELEESPWSDASIDDLVANVEGLERAYRVGLSPVVYARSSSIDRRVLEAMAGARAALSAVPRPFARAVAEQAPEASAAYEAVDALWVILRTEVVGVLGAVLKLNDNDGD